MLQLDNIDLSYIQQNFRIDDYSPSEIFDKYCITAFVPPKDIKIIFKAKACIELAVFLGVRYGDVAFAPILQSSTTMGGVVCADAIAAVKNNNYTNEILSFALTALYFEILQANINFKHCLYLSYRDKIHQQNEPYYAVNEEELFLAQKGRGLTNTEESSSKDEPTFWYDKSGNAYILPQKESANQKLLRLTKSINENFRNDLIRQRAIDAHKAITGADLGKLEIRDVGCVKGKYIYQYG